MIRELMGAYATDEGTSAGRLRRPRPPPAMGRGPHGGASGCRPDELRGGRPLGRVRGGDERAPGTAIAVDRPVQVFAAEHFLRPVRRWTCAAAPLHDPRTGRVLGAAWTSRAGTGSPIRTVWPSSRRWPGAAESHLALLAPSPASDVDAVRLSALGRDEALLVARGRRLRLSRRHSEILVALARRPEGLERGRTAGRAVRGRVGDPATLRAELSRLRRLLGPDLLESRPYRLAVPVDADFDTVTRRLGSGAVAAALDAYCAGPLLPGSGAPAVVRLRRRIEEQLQGRADRPG